MHDRFLAFFAILFLVHCNAVAMFRVCAALTRDMVLATSLGSAVLVMYLMLSGYIFAKRARPASHRNFTSFISPTVSHCCCSDMLLAAVLLLNTSLPQPCMLVPCMHSMPCVSMSPT